MWKIPHLFFLFFLNTSLSSYAPFSLQSLNILFGFILLHLIPYKRRSTVVTAKVILLIHWFFSAQMILPKFSDVLQFPYYNNFDIAVASYVQDA